MTALDIDNAVSLRLLFFDNDIAKRNAQLIAYEVSKMFGDGSDSGGGGDFGESDAVVW